MVVQLANDNRYTVSLILHDLTTKQSTHKEKNNRKWELEPLYWIVFWNRIAQNYAKATDAIVVLICTKNNNNNNNSNKTNYEKCFILQGRHRHGSWIELIQYCLVHLLSIKYVGMNIFIKNYATDLFKISF